MNHNLRKLYNALAANIIKWQPVKVASPSFNGFSRRAVMFGGILAFSLSTDVYARAIHGGIAVGGGGGGALNAVLTLKTKSGSNLANNQLFEFGLPIAPAAMTTSQKLVLTDASSNVLTVQEDNRVVDANGDVRWIMVTSVLGTAPAAATTNIAITATSGSPDTSNAISIANLLAQTISSDTFECQNEITLPNGDVYTAKATDGLNASGTWTYGSPMNEGVWRQGPLCTEFVVYVPYELTGTPHPYLYAAFHIAAYKTSGGAWNSSTNPVVGTRCFVFNENGFNGVMTGWAGTPQDYAYDWSIKMGASTLSTALALTGAAGAGTLTLGATNGSQVNTARSSGTWAVHTTTPNSSDVGKALYQISTGKIAYITGLVNSTNISACIAVDQAWTGTSIGAADWKEMGVYHYWGSRVSNTNPAIDGSWWGANHDLVYPILTTDYIKASEMVPNYRCTQANAAASAPNLSSCDRDGAHPAGMTLRPGFNSIKNYDSNEASTGEAPQIGQLTLQQAVAVIWWDSATEHANARKLLMYNSEVGHRKPLWFRNEEHGKTNSLSEAGVYQTVATNDSSCPQINAYRGTSGRFFTFASNHTGQTDYFPYLMTGRLYCLQNLQQVASQYPMQGSGYKIFDANALRFTITLPSTITGNNGTGSFPCETGEGLCVRYSGYRPQIAGVNMPFTNHYYYRKTGANTGQLYDTWANAQAGSATGRIVFSATGTNTNNYFTNGFVKNDINFAGDQCRSYAWAARSAGQPLVLAPDNPISPDLIAPGNTKAQIRRQFDNFIAKYVAQFAGNTAPSGTSEFLAGFKPRFRNVQNGTQGGQWQMNYGRHAEFQLYEGGAQSRTSSDLKTDLEWILADAIQWHIETAIPPAFYNSGYYIHVSTNRNTGNSPTYNDFAGIFTACVGTPYATSQGGVAYTGMDPSNRTASISSVANPAAVVVTLSGDWFDPSFKSDYEGRAWFGTKTGGGAINGYGRIVTIDSATQITVDFTVTSAYGYTITPVVPPTGSGQAVRLPFPPVSVFYTNVASTDISYTGGGGSNTSGLAYGIADRSSLEIAKQMAVNDSNYTAAVAEMTGRNMSTAYNSGYQETIKYNLVSRV